MAPYEDMDAFIPSSIPQISVEYMVYARCWFRCWKEQEISPVVSVLLWAKVSTLVETIAKTIVFAKMSSRPRSKKKGWNAQARGITFVLIRKTGPIVEFFKVVAHSGGRGVGAGSRHNVSCFLMSCYNVQNVLVLPGH